MTHLIRFYDNDMKHITKVNTKYSNEIESIHVDHDIPNQIYEGQSYNVGIYTVNYNRQYSENTYAKKILEPKNREIKLASNGMTGKYKDSTYMEELLIWASTNPTQEKTVFFDWDRTLSVVEGFFSPNIFTPERGDMKLNEINFRDPKGWKMKIGSNTDLVTTQDLLEYIMGGPERLEQIKYMMTELHKNNVNIFILTNNGIAQKKMDEKKLFRTNSYSPIITKHITGKHPHRDLFIFMASLLHESITEDKLLSSMDYEEDKAETLKHEYFEVPEDVEVITDREVPERTGDSTNKPQLEGLSKKKKKMKKMKKPRGTKKRNPRGTKKRNPRGTKKRK